MKSVHPDFAKSIEIAARFGFISQDIFTNYVTTRKRTVTYSVWSSLKKSDYFEQYDHSTISENYLKLSRFGKWRVDDHCSFIPVAPPSPRQLTHDEALVKFALHNERKGFIESARPEAHTKTQNSQFAKIFAAQNLKFPDLLFDLGAPEKRFRVALELERTRKSNSKYQANLLCYSVQKHVDIVIFVTSHGTIEKAIKDAALRINYPAQRKPIAFAKTNEFLASPSEFVLQIDNRIFKFDDFVQKLSQKPQVAA